MPQRYRHTKISIVFRGDRGLEPESLFSQLKRGDCDRLSGRSRIGTFTATPSCVTARKLRSSFGAIEDWNRPQYTSEAANSIAIVFRGDRGLEQLLRKQSELDEVIAIVFRGDRGLEQ